VPGNLPHWAHYSSVSRTLAACDAQTVQAVHRPSKPSANLLSAKPCRTLLRAGRVLLYDLDLMGQPVSATSTTYPQAAFGWMDDHIQLGYQLARICLTDKQGQRLWLQGFHHPGDTGVGVVRARTRAGRGSADGRTAPAPH